MTFTERLLTLQAFDPKTLRYPSAWLFMAGLISALGFEPVGWDMWVLAPAFWLLLQLCEDVSLKSAFYRGWIFGLGHYLGGLYWIAISLTVDFKQFFWLFPLAVGAIPGILALLSGICTGVTCLLPLKGWVKAVSFCVAWCCLEWLRGHVLGGFPWNLMGYTWVSSLKILQIVNIIGIYGLSLLTMLMAVFTFDRRGVWITGLLWIGLWGYGHYRLQQPTLYVQGALLRLVQPCIKQELKWKPEERASILNTLYVLSRKISLKPPTHIIWPESAAVFDVMHDKNALDQIQQQLPSQAQLIFGAPHIQRNDNGKIEKIWNSVFSWYLPQGLRFIYNKVHLVPFGEYLPFRKLLPSFMDKVTPGQLDYSKGTGLVTVEVGNASLPPFSPLICYEVIFPGKVANFSQKRPEWILNLTNDAWFGRSSGPYQHLAMAQTRAVETGLPLVRSANNGISAIVDPYGRLLQSLPLNEEGVLDSPLPKALPDTLYNRWGDTFFWALIGGLCFIIGMALIRHPQYNRRKIKIHESPLYID